MGNSGPGAVVKEHKCVRRQNQNLKLRAERRTGGPTVHGLARFKPCFASTESTDQILAFSKALWVLFISKRQLKLTFFAITWKWRCGIVNENGVSGASNRTTFEEQYRSRWPMS